MAGEPGGPEVEVRAARDESELAAARGLRVRIFSEQQGVPYDAEIDGLDRESTHLVAIRRGTVVATCRLRFARERCKLERMVVDPVVQSTGLGRRLLESAEQTALEHGVAEIVLHAQRRVEAFYAACGYGTEGETFLEEGIPHVLMRKRLVAAEAAG